MRAQVVGTIVLLLTIGLASAGLLAYRVQRAGLDSAAAVGLAADVGRFRQLADGVDPRTGQPWSDLDRLLDAAVDRRVTAPDNVLATVVNDSVRSIQEAPLAAEVEASTLARDVADRPAGGYSNTELASGTLAWAAIPVSVNDDPRPAWFVTGHLYDQAYDDVIRSIRTQLLVYLAVVVLAGSVGWILAGRLLLPLAELRDAARSVGDRDLGRRIPVAANATEVSDVAVAFNAMMARLEAAFVSQRRLLDDVGHELRTPITVVRGHMDLVDPDDPADVGITREIVLDELSRMSRLVDDLLTLARSDGPDFVVTAPVDIVILVDDVLVKMVAMAPRAWRLDAVAEGTVALDRERVTQALLELAVNAIRHTGTDDVIAVGSALEWSNEQAWVRIWVRDTGSGLDPEDEGRVFQRFERGSGEGSDGGSGLGLNIVSAIAAGHGGHVELDNNPGTGATFALVLPVDSDRMADLR